MWKLFGTILSIAVLKATAETNTACTMEFIAQYGSVFAIPGSCEKYMVCRSGRLIELNCPTGMLFDVQSSRCIGEHQAECLAESWSIADGLCESDGIFPDPHSCARFVICMDQKALPGQCSAGLLFDSVDLRCVVPKDVRCSLRCPNNDEEQVYLPDSTGQDCSRYYVCKDGVPHLAECPSMMYFDLLKKTCTLPENASCRIEGVVCSDYDEFVVNPKSCSSYYKCERGYPYFRECGGDFVDEICSISSEGCESMNETENSTEVEPSTTNMTPTPEISTESSTMSSTLSEPQTSSTVTVTTESWTSSEGTSSTSSTPVDLTTETITTETPMTETPSTVTEQPSTTDSTMEPTTATQTEQPTTETSERTSTQEPSTVAPPSTIESSTATPATTPVQPSTESSTATDPTTVSTQEPSTVVPPSTIESSTATPATTPVQPSTESSTVTVSTTLSTQEPSTVTPTEQPTTVTDVTLTTGNTDSSTTEAQSTVTPTTTHPPVDPAEMCRDLTIGVVKHPYNCYQYFVCLFGAGVEATCSSEMIFDPDQLACVPGDRATCTPTF